MNDNKRKLYDALSQDYDLGTFEQFESDIADAGKRRKLYDATIEEYDFGDFSEFENQLGFTPQAQGVPQADTAPQQGFLGKAYAQATRPVADAGADKSAYTFTAEELGLMDKPEKPQGTMWGEESIATVKLPEIKPINVKLSERQLKELREQPEPERNEAVESGSFLTDEHKKAREEFDKGLTPIQRMQMKDGSLSALNAPDIPKNLKYDYDFKKEFGYFPGGTDTEFWNFLKTKTGEEYQMKMFGRPLSDYEIAKLSEDARRLGFWGTVGQGFKGLGYGLKGVELELAEGIADLFGVEHAKENINEERERILTAQDNFKPTAEGVGGFVAEMIPQMAGTGLGLLVSAVNPVAGAAIVNASTAAQVASSMGSTALEARRAGASDAQTAVAMLLSGGAELLSEKYVNSKYIKRIMPKAADVVAEAGDKALESEFNKLLQTARKELGGKFTAKTAKDLVGDMFVEGASEFSAEAVQALIPIVYEHKEDFPNIVEVFNAGLEGFAGGVFMGGIFGGTSSLIQSRANNRRRREQGFVDVANVEIGGKPTFVEVLGKDKDGNFVVLNGDETVAIKESQIKERKRFDYNDFRNAEVEYAREIGYEQEPTGENAVKEANEYANARNEVVKVLGLAEDADVDAMLEGRTAEEIAMGDTEIEDAVNYYIKARARRDGFSERYQEERDRQFAESDRSIDETANDGMVYTTTTPSGEKIIITGGKVVLDNEGYIDVNQSEGLVAMFPDSSRKPVRPGDLREKVEVSNAEETKAARRASIEDRWRAEFESAENAYVEQQKRAEGIVFDVTDKEGTHRVEVVKEGEEMSNILVDGEQKQISTEMLNALRGEAGVTQAENEVAPVESTVPTAEEVADAQAFADAYAANTLEAYQNYLDNHPEGAYRDGARNGMFVLEGTDVADVASITNARDVLERAAANEVQPEVAPVATTATTEMQTAPEAQAETVQPTPKTALEQIPRNEKNVPLYEQVDSELAWDGVVEEAGGNEETAMVAVNSMIADKQDALKKAEKAKAKAGVTIAEKIAAENERVANIEKAKADLAKWEEIAGVKAKRAAAQAENVDQPVAETAPVVESAPVADNTPQSQSDSSPTLVEQPTPQATNEMQEADLTNDVKIEDVNQSENNLEMVAEGGNAPGNGGASVNEEVGPFGRIYRQFKGKAKEAIQFLLGKKEGEAVGALSHPEIGDIDLVWGEEGTSNSDGYGLAKLAKYHPEVLDNLQEIINDMRVTKRSANRVQLESDTHQAAVRLTWDNKSKNWLLTAFEKKNSVSDNTTDTGETSNGGKQNDTATLQNTVSTDEGTTQSAKVQENTQKSKGNAPKRVNVESLMGALKQNGEAKLSDHVEQTTNPSGNKLVTDERYNELKERMKKKLKGQMNIGVDPEILAIGTEMAVYHIEKGARKFADFAKGMIADLGDAIRPYLKAFYNGARELPEIEEAGFTKDMTPYEGVKTFDVANFDKQAVDAMAAAETVTRETEVAKDVEAVKAPKKRESAEGKKLRKATQEDLEGNPVVYYKGEKHRILMLVHRGEQTSGARFTKPEIARVYLENMQDVKVDDLYVEDTRENVGESGDNSVPSQQTPVNNLNENNDGREEITAADNSGAQPGREELPDTEQVGAGVPVQDTARNSKSKRRNAGVGSSKLGNGPQYDVNRNYTNEEIEEIVSSVTDIVDGKVVITGEVTDDIKAIVRGYESGGIAKKGRGILDEYYTDGKIVDAVNLLIAPYFSGSTPIRVLEPSVGTGNFIQAVNNIPTSEVVAFEINETTARIAKILYPDVDVNLRSFETEFIDESGNKKPMPQKYSLVIGNPPYGSHRGLYKGLGEESKIARYEDYFVKRSLDVLDEGGVLAMVLPSSWMDRHTKFGGYTIERAYRLPSGAFEATQVGTDIVILKKDSSVPVTEHVPYFEQFPERVLGEVKQRKGRYGRLEEYVEGDIDAAIEAIKKENAEQVADLLDIEKNNDALNDIESAVDETGSLEKAVAIVKDAQESEKAASKREQSTSSLDAMPSESGLRNAKADKKPAKKPSGKQGKYKVELNRGVEAVPTSAQFTHEFSEGEVEAFADTDYEGALSNPAKHRRYANYIGGQAIHDFYYAEGDIYSKLAQLEQEKNYIVENYGVEQYDKQKALLESVLPKQKSLEEITISPNTTFVKNLNILTEGGRVSLKDMFVDFLRKLPRQAFGNSSSWEVVGYINNEQVHGTDKQRNQLIRERRKRVANDLFNKFLSEELSDNAKKQVVAAFNREYNSTYRPDYSKVPMFSTINRDFKGKPLKLTSVQLAGIGRMTVKGVGVLAHEVGFGKTLSGILAMHEAMTRGFAKKPLIVVPNDNILKQWVETIGEVLPNATVNTLGNLGAGYDLTDFKVNDGEFTIITYEGLKAMSFSDGTYNHLASKFSYITEDLNKYQSERDIQKEIEKKNELKGKMKRGTKSSYMFEGFGFDWLTVDEVHNANHIVSKVRLDKSVASDFRSQSQRTSDLGLKTWLAAQYIQEENNGRNVLLLSATPFTNKPLEYYSILSLVGNDMLERKGFFNVDQFFATFMEADNELEIGANGRPTQKTNVRRFRNNGLFQQLLSEFIDIKGEEDNPELVRPERLNKEYKIAQNELTAEAMAAAQELLSDNDTVLQGIGHARAAAFSPYATALLGMQPKNHKEFVKNSPKIDATIRMIEQNIKDRPDAGQIVYSEVGVEYFPLIRDYLVKESGLKPSEVRIITGATSNNERVNIQTAFNNGEVKVVIGSPAIKEGLNLQGNTTDMYILSLPWNFTQLRQIEGRGWRQGNRWENIRINYMLTNDSVDVFMLQRLQLKQGLYNEAMKSGAESLDVSDIDTAELKTALITDPAVRAEIVTVQERAKLQQEKTQIEADLSFVMRKYEAYNKLVEKLGSQKNTIKMYREWAKKGDEYWAQRAEREEAQLPSLENEIEEEKQNLLKKGVNVDDIVRQTEQAQNAIAAIQEKIDNLKEFQEELTQKFREESEAKAKEQGDLVSTYIKERKAENKGGFYKIRPEKTESKAAEEEIGEVETENGEVAAEDDILFREGQEEETARERMVAGEDITPEMKEGGVINPKSNRNIENKDITLHKTKDGRIVRYEQLDLFNNDERAVTDIQRNTSKGNGNANNGAGAGDIQRGDYTGGNSLAQINVPLRPLEKGEMSLVQRIFTKSRAFDFTAGEQIESLEDVAYIFKNLEDESIENSFAVLVKDGMPMVLHLGMGGYTSTIINATAVAVAMENVKPDKVYFVHNHPSGALKASANDVEVLQKLRTNYGDIVEKGIIINLKSGKFGVYDVAQATSEVRDEKTGDGLEVPVEIFTFNKQVFDKDFNPSELFQIYNADDIAAFISSNRLGDRNKIGLLVCNNQLKVVGNVFTPYIGINSAAAQKIAKDVVYYTTVMGGNRPILFGRFPVLSRAAKSNLEFYINSYSGGQIKLVDLVDVESSESVLNEEGAFYGDITKGNAVERVNLGEPEGGSLFREGETLFRKKKLTPEQKKKQEALKENAKAIRRLHNVKANYPITALRNLGFALETQEQREMHDRLFAERDAMSGRENAVSVEVNPQGMTLQERITENLLKMAEQNKDNVELRLSAIRAYGRDLANVIKLMRAQRGYDRNTVNMFVSLAKMYLRNNAMSGMSSYDISRLLGLISRANGGYGPQVMRAAEQIAEIITKSHTRELEDIVRKQIKTGAEKVNASGVVVQGGVDVVGKRVLNTFRDAVNMTSEEEFEKAFREAFERAAKFPNDVEAKAACDAMVIAKEYRDNIVEAKKQESELLKSINQYSDIRSRYDRGEITRREYNEFVDAVRKSLIELRSRMVDDYQRIIHALGGDISEGMKRAKEFRERELARVEKIHNMAEADMSGVSKSAERKKRGFWRKATDYVAFKNPLAKVIAEGLGTYNEFMKFFGRNAIGGKGRLYDYFIGRYTEVQNQEWVEKQKDIKKIDERCKMVFGKGFKGVMRDSEKNSGVVLEYWNGGERVSRDLSIGQLMYIYMTAKQTDGEMKLRGMGITEETVNKAVAVLPARYKVFADWVQSDFLPEMRPRLNEVHKRMFGASMSEVKNYFPLVVNTDARQAEVDLNSVMPITPSTITGAIIKRKVNATPLNLESNAFDVLLNHVSDMEHWAAFAEFTRDNNTLIGDKDFMNRVKNSRDLRFGDGEAIWNNFVETARITTGNYRAKKDEWANVMKGVSSAKITFGYYTALKQFLSAPALWLEASTASIIKATVNPLGSWRWAIENLPGFEERWKGRTAGNERLADSDSDWSIWDNRVVKAAREAGMAPNAFVDAVVVSTGARAVYDSRKRFYKVLGLSQKEQHKRALKDAAVAYNETQQSAQGAYLSILQKEGGFKAMVMTLYRNSQMAYSRKVTGSMGELYKKAVRWKVILDNEEKKYLEMGLSEEDAKKEANKALLKSAGKDVATLVMFGYVLNMVWYLGEQLPYLLFGDDEEEKEKIMDTALKIGATGMFEGFALGNVAKDLYVKGVTGNRYSSDMLTTPFASDAEKIINRFANNGTLAGMSQLLILGAETATGISPQRLIDDVAAVIDFCNGDLDKATEVTLLTTRLAKVPQSQIDKLYLEEALGGDVVALAERYAEYKRLRDYPLNIGDDKILKKYAERFKKAHNEDLKEIVRDENAYEGYFSDASPEEKIKLAGYRGDYLEELTGKKAEEVLTGRELVYYTLYGRKEQNLVYGAMTTPDDVDDEICIEMMMSELQPIQDEYMKVEDWKAYKKLHEKELDMYKDLKRIESDISYEKSKMKENPVYAEEGMTEIRTLRAEAVELINKYRNE